MQNNTLRCRIPVVKNFCKKNQSSRVYSTACSVYEVNRVEELSESDRVDVPANGTAFGFESASQFAYSPDGVRRL
jgi:hypothetical protein